MTEKKKSKGTFDNLEGLGAELAAKAKDAKETSKKASTPKAESKVNLSGLSDKFFDLENQTKATLLVYGKNGTGKTTFSATGTNTLLVACEDGTRSLKGTKNAKNITAYRINTWEDFTDLFLLLQKSVTGSGKVMLDGKKQIDKIAIDTVTKLADICLRDVVLGEVKKDPTREVTRITQANWGEMTNKVVHWLELYRNELPVDTLWLMQERRNGDSADIEEFSIVPYANRALNKYVLEQADIIARSSIVKVDGEVKFILNAAPHPLVVTKDRSGKLKTAIPNANWDKLLKYINK